MKRLTLFNIRAVIALSTLVSVASVKADFTGSYALTPPAPGIYTGGSLSTCCGNWEALGLSATVNTENAPGRLELSVPAGSIFANLLIFQTTAAASGTVGFDYIGVSRATVGAGGYLFAFREPGGGGRVDFALGRSPANHLEFQVEQGEVFGFRLLSGSDAFLPGEPMIHSLTIDNFFAPVPEPGTWALLAGGLALMAGYLRRRR